MARRSYTSLYTQDGFMFQLTYRENGDGWIAFQHNVDLSDPAFLEALQKVHCDYEVLEPYQDLHVRLGSTHLDKAKDETINELLELLERAKATGVNLKSPLVHEFINWLNSREIYSLAEKLNPAIVDERAGLKTSKSVLDKGYVYLIQSPTGTFKIGRTNNPKNRMKTFSVKLPFEVSYLCLVPTTNMYKLERALHQKFAHRRVNGEWFALDETDVAYIRSLATVESESAA